MKIGVSSYSFSKYMERTGCDYLKICDLSKEMGYDAIEFIDLNPKVSGKEPLETAAEISAHCAEIGLDVAAYTVGANFLCENPDAEVERLKKCVDVAKALGAGVMRHDCCWGLRQGAGRYTWHEAVEETAPYIRRLTEYAAAQGVKTCTENHGFIIQNSERVETLIRTVNHPNYGWLVDIGNFICADEDSVHAVSNAAPYAFHVHVKDFLCKPGSVTNPGMGWFRTRGGNYVRGTIVGNGVIPVDQCLYILRQAGYDGCVSVEFEGLEDNLTALKAGIDYIKRVSA